MGEVRIQVSLTNAVDEGMAYRGQMEAEDEHGRSYRILHDPINPS